MSLVTVDDLVTFSKKPANQADYYMQLPPGVLTPDAAKEWLDGLRAVALDNKQQCKRNRPWSIVDFSKMLDPEQAWIGFEYETGFDKKADYEKAITFLWDNQNYNALDREGSGKYPFEVAFSPQTLGQFVDGTSNIQQYFAFMQEHGLKMAHNPTTYTRRAIGMHVNVSTPASRKTNADAGYGISRTLYAWIDSMSKEQHEELFGRYQHNWPFAQQRTSHRKWWIEYKVFKSTDDIAVFAGYVRTTIRLAQLLDHAVANAAHPTNLYEFLSGKDEAIKTDGKVPAPKKRSMY